MSLAPFPGQNWRVDPHARQAHQRLREGRDWRDRAAERLHKRNTAPERRRPGWGTRTTGRPKWAREKEGASR